jgi:hypothetical protein
MGKPAARIISGAMSASSPRRHGSFSLPDLEAHSTRRVKEAVYTVRFDGGEVWQDGQKGVGLDAADLLWWQRKTGQRAVPCWEATYVRDQSACAVDDVCRLDGAAKCAHFGDGEHGFHAMVSRYFARS